MGYILCALFIGVPILEISVFISVGEEIGLNWTLAIVILTAVTGTWMMKRQGLKTLFRLQSQLNQGQLPLREVFDGFCLLLAGAFLLTPGFVTDGVGFLLLMLMSKPPVPPDSSPWFSVASPLFPQSRNR